jgi:hypothetical protein
VEHACSGVICGVDADSLFTTCFRDFGTWGHWVGDEAQFTLLSGSGREVGAVRCVDFAPDKRLHEQLLALDDVARVTTYAGINYGTGADIPPSANPFPGAFVDYVSSISVEPVTVCEGDSPCAFMRWSGSLWTEPASDKVMKETLNDFYSRNIRKLQERYRREQ